MGLDLLTEDIAIGAVKRTAAKPSLQARKLVRSFGTGELRTVALHEVSLDLRPGQMTLLIGPSGSGKSTLLAVLSGLLRPDRGAVRALGQDLWSFTDRKREVFRRRHCGFIFQGYNLFPALTARQQLEIILQWGEKMNRSAAQQLAERTLAALDLHDKTHLRPHQLSGGEKQRVAVARALVKRPALIFADEPTAALDWPHGKQVVELLCQAARTQQATVVVVSHDPRIIPLADRVLQLQDGRLREPRAVASTRPRRK